MSELVGSPRLAPPPPGLLMTGPLRLYVLESTPGVVARFSQFCERTGLQFRAREVQVGPIPADDGEDPDDGRVTPLLLRLERTAEVLDVSPTTVKRLIRGGELPAVKVNGATRVRVEDLRTYVERLASAAVPGQPDAS